MSVEWIGVLRDSVLTRVAMVLGCGLTVVGEDRLWRSKRCALAGAR